MVLPGLRRPAIYQLLLLFGPAMSDCRRSSGRRMRAQSPFGPGACKEREAQSQVKLSRHAFVKLEFGFTHHIAHLHTVFGIVDFPSLFLRGAMFGVHTPGTHPFFMLDLHYVTPFTVYSEKALLRNVAGHRLRQFDHAIDKGYVLLACPRAQAGTNNSDDHGESPCRVMLAHPDMLDQFRF